MKKNIVHITLIFLAVALLTMLIYVGILVKQRRVHAEQAIWAGEIRKASGHLMLDLFQAQAGSIQDVPIDGRWHPHIIFKRARVGTLEYRVDQGHLLRIHAGQGQVIAEHVDFLHLRRQKDKPDILEAQMKVKGLPIVNLKIRTIDSHGHS